MPAIGEIVLWHGRVVRLTNVYECAVVVECLDPRPNEDTWWTIETEDANFRKRVLH